MKRNDGHCAGNQLEDDGGHHVAQGEDAQDEEVEGEQEIYVFFAEDVEEDVESKESAGSDNGKHHGVFLCHGLWSLSRLLLLIIYFSIT